MSKVVDIRTRTPVEPAPITPEEPHEHTRQLRFLRNWLIDCESFGVRLTVVRQWLISQLAYVDAKIVQQQNGTKQ